MRRMKYLLRLSVLGAPSMTTRPIEPSPSSITDRIPPFGGVTMRTWRTFGDTRRRRKSSVSRLEGDRIGDGQLDFGSGRDPAPYSNFRANSFRPFAHAGEAPMSIAPRAQHFRVNPAAEIGRASCRE